MMGWKFLTEQTIAHEDGHKIDLLDGDWSSPMGIQPSFATTIDAVKSASLIRAGLKFAATNKLATRAVVKAEKKVVRPKSVPGRPILKLKR